MTSLRVAVAAYPIDFLASWAEYQAKLTRWITEAAEQGAQLLVFPEYAPLELISLLPTKLHHDVLGMRPALQAFFPDFIALHRRLAVQFGVTVVAGSYPTAHAGGFVNRAHVFSPSGTFDHQDKLLMTRFEGEEWQISPGTGVKVFRVQGFKFGIAICYDSEFPHLARALAEAGAELLVVPSFTGSAAGFTRVRVGSLARALENQCYAVHAPLLAEAGWTYAVESAVGRASIYAPADNGLPASGIVAEAGWTQPGWLIHDLDFSLTRNVRVDGHVLNWRDRVAGQARVTAPQEVSLD